MMDGFQIKNKYEGLSKEEIKRLQLEEKIISRIETEKNIKAWLTNCLTLSKKMK